MAVLQEYPVTILLTCVDQLFSLGTWALTQGDHLESLCVIALLCKLDQSTCRIGTGTQHEDQWCLNISILVDYVHSRGWRFYEELTHLLDNIVLEGKQKFLGSEGL